MQLVRAGGGGLRADRVDADRLAARLVSPIAGPVEWHKEVGSTNDLLAQRARAGAPEGAVLGADHQTAGRGRLGREWRDVAGRALALSVLLRPPERLAAGAGVLSMTVAAAVAAGLSPRARVAWPNDVLIAERKVAGILLEAAWEGAGLRWVVAGIGVNVSGAPDVPPGAWPPGALDELGAGRPREDVSADVLIALARGYEALCKEGATAMVRAFAERDALAGRIVRVQVGERVREGSAAGIGDDGSLRVRTEAGVETFVSADRLEALPQPG